MKKRDITPFVGIAGGLILVALVAIAGSYSGRTIGGLSIFGLCAIVAIAIQWAVFIPAYRLRTEKFFDLTGSLTYIMLVIVAIATANSWDARSIVLAALVIVWAARLGTFLFTRVLASGGDARFDSMKHELPSFLQTWTLQGVWVLLTASAALAAITTENPSSVDWTVFVGAAIWATGLAIEATADAQKRRFRKDARNKGAFIRTGIWAWSRHPNYFGEIVLWIGVAVVAAPSLAGWQWVTMISPIFVFLLLTRVSGVPMLERRGKKRWGDDPAYRAYLAATPVLVPRPPRKVARVQPAE